MKKELIHKRTISVNCYETDEERLIVEGSLTDERLFPYVIHALNEKRDAGLMHHMTLTMELTIPDMKILSIMAEMPVVPDAGCSDVKEAVQKLEGRFIRPGFTNEVRATLRKGVGMSSSDESDTGDEFGRRSGIVVLLQPFEGRGAALSLPGTDGSMLLDSCHMWRKEGPFVEKIRQRRMAERKKRS